MPQPRVKWAEKEEIMENLTIQNYRGANFLVELPVCINIWIRPECQRRQFEVIRQAKPSVLFLISDGGRTDAEWQAIFQNRTLYDEGIDWNCTVYKLYERQNQGMYAEAKRFHELVWSKVDRCAFLEDDVLPSVSFFRYCAELLERYKDDLRVNVICGMNHLGVWEKVQSDYFFSRQGSIWGYAMWKRTYEQYYDFEYVQDSYVMDCMQQRTRHNPKFWRRICGYANNPVYEGHPPFTEYYFELSMYLQNQLQIIPKYNLISNIGCTVDAAHSSELKLLPHEVRRVFNMKTYELSFPLRHAKYVLPDVTYEKKRNQILAYNCPWRSKLRGLEHIVLQIRHGKIKQAGILFLRRVQRILKIDKKVEK